MNKEPIELDDEMSIDEQIAHWLEHIPVRKGLDLVQLPRHQVRAFLAAATINPGTIESAKKLQAKLSFHASVIDVPVKSFRQLLEAFQQSSQPTQPAKSPERSAGNPAIGSESSDPGVLVAPNAPRSTSEGVSDASVDGSGDASKGLKAT